MDSIGILIQKQKAEAEKTIQNVSKNTRPECKQPKKH